MRGPSRKLRRGKCIKNVKKSNFAQLFPSQKDIEFFAWMVIKIKEQKAGVMKITEKQRHWKSGSAPFSCKFRKWGEQKPESRSSTIEGVANINTTTLSYGEWSNATEGWNKTVGSSA